MAKHTRTACIVILIASFFVLPQELIDSPVLSQGVACAEWIEQQISDSAQLSYDPTMSCDDTGDVHLAWHDESSSLIRYMKGSDGGATWGNPMSLGGLPLRPSISTDSRYVQLVYDARYQPNPSYRTCHITISPDSGESWGPSAHYVYYSSNSHNPTIASKSGKAFAVCEFFNSGTARYYIRSSWSVDQGQSWAHADIYNCYYSAGLLKNAHVDCDSNGFFYNVWEHHASGIAYIKFRSGQFTPGGIIWGDVKNVAQRVVSNDCNPRVACDNAGNILVVWSDASSGNYEIYGVRLRNYGGTVDAPFNISNALGNSTSPSVTCDVFGNAHVAWSDSKSGDYEIYHAKGPDLGLTWEAIERVTDSSGYSENPVVSTDLFGNVHIAWEDSRNGNYAIFYANNTSGPTTYSISGNVTLVGQTDHSGVLVSAVGSSTLTGTTDINGNYTINDVPAGSYTMSASKTDYNFAPNGSWPNPLTVSDSPVSGIDFFGTPVGDPEIVINTLWPDSGPRGRAVSLIGSNFGTTKATLMFGAQEIAHAQIPIWQPYQISFYVPMDAIEGAEHEIQIFSGTDYSNIVTFEVTLDPGYPLPAITNMVPFEGAAGQIVTLTGENFGDQQGDVFFEGIDTEVRTWSENEITFVVPYGMSEVGLKHVQVAIDNLRKSNIVMFNLTSTSPAPGSPYITGISPSTAEQLQSVSIFGYNFGTSKQTIMLNNSPIDQSYIQLWTDNQIIFMVPQDADLGINKVRVEIGLMSSNYVFLTVINDTANPPPSIEDMNRFSGERGVVVNILGDHFGDTEGTVWFNGIPAPIYENMWQNRGIAILVPQDAPPGWCEIYVERTDSKTSNSVMFNVTGGGAPPPPSVIIDEVVPASGLTDRSVTVLGHGFGSDLDEFYFDEALNNSLVTHWSENMIIFTVPVGTSAGAKEIYVTVGGEESNHETYDVTNSGFDPNQPSITDVDPFEGPTGISVTLKGENLGVSGILYFDGSDATASVTQWTEDFIVLTVPSAGSPGIKEILVNVGGLTSNTVVYRVTDIVALPVPSIRSINPTEGPVDISVTLNGENFGETEGTILFDDPPAAPSPVVTMWSDTQIIFTVPTGISTGLKDIRVEAADLQQSNAVQFNVTSTSIGHNVPSITRIDPESGPREVLVTLTGTRLGMFPGELYFNGFEINARIDSWGVNEITFYVPDDANSGENTVHVTANGEQSNTVIYTVTSGTDDDDEDPINYPNPFDPTRNETTTFMFGISGPAEIAVYVYDLTGRIIWKTEETVTTGQITWDGRDNLDRIAPNGVYLALIVDKDNNELIGKCKPFIVKSE